jgi:uncharacterized protein YggE
MRTLHLATAATAATALAFSVAGCAGGSARGAGAAPVVLAAAGPAPGSPTTGTTITTTGIGTVNGSPDTLSISIDVSTNAPHAADALAQNNAIAAKVQQVLRTEGVAAPDIQTEGLWLGPTNPPAPAGYAVDDTVTATLRNLATAGTVIDDAVAAVGDAGRLGTVNLSISNTSPLVADARQRAVAAARLDAQQLASAAGEHLGHLVSLTEQPQSNYYPGSYSAGAGAAQAAPVPVQPGTQQLTVNVTTVWAVGP